MSKPSLPEAWRQFAAETIDDQDLSDSQRAAMRAAYYGGVCDLLRAIRDADDVRETIIAWSKDLMATKFD